MTRWDLLLFASTALFLFGLLSSCAPARRCCATVEAGYMVPVPCDDRWHWPYKDFVGHDDCSWRALC